MRCYYMPIRMAKPRKLTYQMLARLSSNRKSHSLLLGIQNGTATLEDCLAASYKVNVVLPSNPAFTLLGIY